MVFKPICIEDKELITSFTYSSAFQNCDFAFSNMCSWRFLYDSEYAVFEGNLLIRFYIEEKEPKRMAYMFPVGNGNLRRAVEALEKDSYEMMGEGHPLLILGVTSEARKKLEELFPNEFAYVAERDYFDYIYLREDLQTLKGKKWQAKRNHINKFKKQYEYTYIPITPEIVPQCMALERKWVRANENEENTEELSNEHRSMTFAMHHFKELELFGGAIVVEGAIVAFTYGSPINYQTFGVHVEKADTNYEGIFSLINQEFVSHIPEQYVYINREEDLGIPGLRQSKLSYNPVILLEKNGAIKRR